MAGEKRKNLQDPKHFSGPNVPLSQVFDLKNFNSWVKGNIFTRKKRDGRFPLL